MSLVFTVRADGTRIVRRDLEGIAVAAKAAGGAVGGLVSRLASIAAGGLAIESVRRYIDTYTALQNRLRQVTSDTANLTTVTRELFDVADRTRSSFEGTANMYSRVALATKEYGYAQGDLLTFVERVNQAIILSGATAVESEAALVQLTQGLSSGVLRGDELRSVLEQLPAVADVIAKSMGTTRGELRKLGAAGKLTTETIINGFLRAGYVGEAFAGTSITIGQATQRLNNRLLEFIGRLDEVAGISSKIAAAITLVVDDFDRLASAALAAGVAIATALAPGVVLRFAAAIGSLFLVMNAHPFVALAAAAAGAVTYIAMMGDEISVGSGHIANMQDVTGYLKVVAEDTWSAVGVAVTWAMSKSDEALSSSENKYADFFANTGTGFSGWIKKIAKVLDAIGGLLTALVLIWADALAFVPGLFAEYFGKAYNAVLSKMESIGNIVIEAINWIRERTGAEPMELIKFEPKEVIETKVQDLLDTVEQTAQMAFSRSTALQDLTDQFFGNVDAFARERGMEDLRRMKGNDYLYTGGGLNGPGTRTAGAPDVDPKAARAARKAAEEFERLKRAIDPMYSATMEFTEAQVILSNFLGKSAKDAAEYEMWMGKLVTTYEDQLDPLNKINKDLDTNMRLLKMGNKERAVEEQLIQITDQLKRQRGPLDAAENAALREKIRLMHEANELANIEDALRQRSNAEVMRVAKMEADAINRMTDPRDKAIAKEDFATRLGLDTEGTQLAVDAQVAMYANMIQRIKFLRQENLIDAQGQAQLMAKVEYAMLAQRMSYYQSFFTDLSSLQEAKSKELAAIGKAAAITEATIAGYLSVQKTLASVPYPYSIPLATAAGIAAAANVAKIAGVGFMEGGYTGDVPKNAVAGAVHGQEFVMNAQATAQNRPVLEAMNAGASVGTGTNLNVNIVNEVPGAEFDVRQIDENTVEVIARRVVREESDGVVATNLRNPNSRTSRSLSQNTKTTRSY